MDEFRRSVELRILPYRKYRFRESFRVIHGHIQFRKYKRAFPDAFYLTFYRDPVRQLVSQYNYWLRTCNPLDINPLRRWVYEDKPCLINFVNEWANGENLQQQVSALNVHDFDFVGITDRFDESLSLLKQHISELVLDIKAPCES